MSAKTKSSKARPAPGDPLTEPEPAFVPPAPVQPATPSPAQPIAAPAPEPPKGKVPVGVWVTLIVCGSIIVMVVAILLFTSFVYNQVKDWRFETSTSGNQETVKITTDRDKSSDSSNVINITTTRPEVKITRDEAINIALKDAGISRDQVTSIRVELDVNSRRAEYEIEFYQGNTEYDYDIDATTGTIRSRNQEAD